MHFHPKMLEVKLGTDPDYDQAVIDYFRGYYTFIESICRVAIHNHLVNQELVGLCKCTTATGMQLSLTTCFQVQWWLWSVCHCV